MKKARRSCRKHLRLIRTLHDHGELNVAMIMEGSVQRAGDRLRINVQLIDAATDEHLWAETYNKELTTTNIFDIQRDIAINAATTLKSTITPEEEERIANLPTENLAAYEAYLLGKQRMETRNADKLTEAVDYFQQAIDLDAEFALAYVGLADSYMLQITYNGLDEEKMFALAEAAINEALVLDDQSGEAYTALGTLKQRREDLDGAFLHCEQVGSYRAMVGYLKARSYVSVTDFTIVEDEI